MSLYKYLGTLDYEMDISIEKEWTDFHFRAKNYSVEDENDETNICIECRKREAMFWTDKCYNCEFEYYDEYSDTDDEDDSPKYW